jgi:hypothetical protein
MADVGDVRTDPEQPPTSDARPRFEPQVERPIPRMRPVFAVALVATLAFAAGVVAWSVWIHPPGLLTETRRLTTQRSGTAGPGSALPAGCTSLEVEQTIRAPSMTDSDRVTCLAVAGKIDRARAMLRAMPGTARMEAIAQVFAVAHPIADRGDDASAGPIMWLVVDFWPQNYMAVFHAGMSDFALGRDDTARTQLENFLAMYSPHDVWRARAEQALAAIGAHAPLDQREAHFPE